MASFSSKLARLPPMPSSQTPKSDGTKARAEKQPAPAPSERPSLDELRERIARIIGRDVPPPPRADPTHTSLPFVLEHTESGPLHVSRIATPPGARVGRAPLVA